MTATPTGDPQEDRAAGDRPTVSLVIPTLGRPENLRRTLAALGRLDVPPDESLEVLVVDNGPSERTRSVVEASSGTEGPRFRYLAEPEGGTSRARNRGIRESRGRLVAFIDDDCLVAPSWLRALVEEFSADPPPDVLGGRVELHDDRDAPVGVRTRRERRDCEWTDVFSSILGCNFCVRRPVIARIGTFDERLGPGTPLLAAEDSDFFYRAHSAGLSVRYSPRPLLYHDHGRRSAEQVAAIQRSYVIGRGGFYAKFILRGDRDVLRLAWWELRECLATLPPSRRDPDASVSPGRRIAWLARGALRWLGSSLTSGGRGSPDSRSGRPAPSARPTVE